MYRGDLAQGIDRIGKLAELMGTLRGVPRLAALKAQTPILRAVQEEFVKGQDPYGRPWAPLRPATLAIHGPPPLSRTLALAVDTDVSLLDGLKNGLAITLGRAYGYFHQVGFRHGRSMVPARRPLPQHGMPKRWREITVQAVKDAIAEIRRVP
jgi:hypothetical protein